MCPGHTDSFSVLIWPGSQICKIDVGHYKQKLDTMTTFAPQQIFRLTSYHTLNVIQLCTPGNT